MPRQVLIDADGCPVVDLTLQIAKQFSVPVIILCDTSHQIEREGAQTLVFDKGADSVDFALVNRVRPGDIVVTQDYGLASMCLAKCARVLDQNGLSRRLPIEGIFFSRPLSTSGTAVVAKSNPSSVAPQTDATTADIYAHLDYKSKQGSAGVIANLLRESKLPK